jgi:PadR family transcriptional regulator PadR
MDSWVTQLRKGLLEFCLLSVMAGRETYGYELIRQLREDADLQVGESTLYPILNRLLDDGYVKVRTVPAATGPSRRYFSLTDRGLKRLAEMRQHWASISSRVNKLQTRFTKEMS